MASPQGLRIWARHSATGKTEVSSDRTISERRLRLKFWELTRMRGIKDTTLVCEGGESRQPATSIAVPTKSEFQAEDADKLFLELLQFEFAGVLFTSAVAQSFLEKLNIAAKFNL